MKSAHTALRFRAFHLSLGTALVLFLLLPIRTSTQATAGRSLLPQRVDDSKLIRLRGNVHPWARPQFDRGPAPPNLRMDRMLLVLRRSPEQEAALKRFMAEQLDRYSPNFHRWLTPREFGDRFGPSDADIHTVTAWLQLYGFQIAGVAPGRTSIEFSGTASDVERALHTEVHKFLVNGEEHWANASDPQIPAVLAPVVVGVNTLHNFPMRPFGRRAGFRTRLTTSASAAAPVADFTYQTRGGKPCGKINSTDFCFTLGPTDFATIYNVLPLWNRGIDGSGQTIAIVGDSDIDIQNARDFRSMFGLPANDPHIVLAGDDPGINPDEFEFDADTQWTGAVAPGATIDLVVAANTNSSLGADTAANFIVNSMTPVPQVLSDAFAECEASLGAARNTFYSNLWQQAAAEGITVSITIGDNGSAGCENPDYSLPTAAPATTGLAVNGIGSTPFNVAVGGTDFDQYPDPRSFWNTSNDASTLASATGYIPETTWNNSCSSAIWSLKGFSTDPLTNCNSTDSNFQTAIVPLGGSGGLSGCAISSASTCSGYAKPAWQNGITPNDGARDVPDVSFFAGVGFGSMYIICQRDLQGAPCDTSNFVSSGGTSITAQVFAGVMALVDQASGGSQGLVNPRLYQLAAQPGASCLSSASPDASCIFYDVVKGTNAQPCVSGSPDCSTTKASSVPAVVRELPVATIALLALASACLSVFCILAVQRRRLIAAPACVLLTFVLWLTIAACGGGSSAGGSGSGGGGGGGGGGLANGILAGYDAAPGYDRATGLGSINITNLVDNW